MAKIDKVKAWGGKPYKLYNVYNTRTDAKFALPQIRKAGWLCKLIEVKDVPGRLDVVYVIYARAKKTPKAIVIKSKPRKPKRHRKSNYSIHITRRKK